MATDPTTVSTGTIPSDWKRLLLLVLFVAALRTFTVANATMPSRDCIVFVRDGLQLENPTRFDDRVAVIKAAEHPPGYPAAVIAMSWLVRPLMGASQPTVEAMALSAQLVSAMSAVVLVFPLFLIARRVFDRNVAFACVAIFETLPVFVEVTSDGISDGLYLLTVTWALWFAIRAIDSTRCRSAFLYGFAAGSACGVGFLVRPDALIVALAIGLTFAGLTIRNLRKPSWRSPFVAGLGLTIATLGVMSPYCLTIGGLTNKPTGKVMSGSQEGDSSKPTFYRRDSGARPGVHVPLAAWWNPVENKGQSKALWATKALGSELLKTAHYTLPFFAIAGLICNRRRLANPRTALLLITIAVHLSVLWLLAWKSDYVSQRHTLLSVMVISIFAPSSFPAIGGWLAKRWPSERVRRWTPWKAGGVLTLIVLASTLPRDFRSLHADRIGHKAAGQWLAKNGSNDIKVLDPFGWAEWYAGRTLHSPPPSAFALDGVYYFIFEPNAKSPHSRLNYFDYIRDRYERGLCELIYQYPEDAPPDKIKVGVYLSRPEPVKK